VSDDNDVDVKLLLTEVGIRLMIFEMETCKASFFFL